jgi:hypothetical protein
MGLWAQGRTGYGRIFAAALAGVILLAQIPSLIAVSQMPDWNGYGATDYEIYMTATRRWLEGGPFYYPEQLVGPYHIEIGHVLYPPVALLLFVPFTFLPPVLWWAVPIGITAWVIWRLRPGPLAWPIMALCWWGPTQMHFISGNPGLWILAALSLAMLYRWPAVLILLKPSLAPFALWGIRDRRWWLGLVAGGVVSLLFLPMWFDWLRAVLNGKGGGLLYSWQVIPMFLIPIVAWLCRPGGRYDIEGRA